MGSAEGRSTGPVLQRSLAGGSCWHQHCRGSALWEQGKSSPSGEQNWVPFPELFIPKSPRLIACCRGLQIWFALCMVLEGLCSDVCGRLILQFMQRAEGRKCFLELLLQPWPELPSVALHASHNTGTSYLHQPGDRDIAPSLCPLEWWSRWPERRHDS